MKKKLTIQELKSRKIDLDLHDYTTGSISAKYEVYTQKGNSGPIKGESNSIIKAFGFRHPKYGDILVDSGFSKDFYKNPPFGNLNFILRSFQKFNKVVYSQKENEDTITQLEKGYFYPDKVLLTHLHPDHTSAIPYFKKNVQVYYGKKENTFYYNLLIGNHLKGRSRKVLDFNNGFQFEDFESAIDLFGDMSVLAISTRGHTKDHISYLINGSKLYFIVGDAELTKSDAQKGIYIGSDYGKKGELDARRSADKIRNFAMQNPEVEVLYSHG